MLSVKNFQELIPSENFVTYNALARFFEGAKPIGKFRYSNGGICYVYDKKGEAVAAIWNYLKIKGVVADLSEFEVYDVFGNLEKPGEKELEDAPLYLKPDKLTKEEFEATLANAADNVSNRYRKVIADAPLEFTATREVIANPSPMQQNYINSQMIHWKEGRGNLTVVQTPKGVGSGLTRSQIGKYLDFDAFPTSTTINSKGTSVTRQSNPTKNSKPISGKELGLDYDIYKTTFRPNANGIAAREGRNEYTVTFYDETGSARDYMIVSEQMEPTTIARQILDNYRNIKPYAKIGGEGLQRSAGMIESQYASGFIYFNTTGANNSPAVANIADLQRTVDDLGKVEYDLNIHEPFYNSIDGNSRKVEIGRTTQGYYIKDISGLKYPDGSVHYGEFGYNIIPNSLYTIKGMTPNNIQYYENINEALKPITEYILTQYGIILDMQEAAEAIQMNKINNANIGY